MSPIAKNILAVVAGVIVGSIVNMGIVMIGPMLIPVPEGVDVMDPESLKAGMSSFEFKHFITPFLAHALGTLAGAFVAAKFAATHKMKFALGLGAWFLLGGITNVVMLAPPMWYSVLDILAAYLPMGWLGGKLADKPAA